MTHHADAVDAPHNNIQAESTYPPATVNARARARHREKNTRESVCARTTRAPKTRKLKRGSVASISCSAPAELGAAIYGKERSSKPADKERTPVHYDGGANRSALA